ncbi:MAG: 3'(2'),5'-bisphosphate nucleotidase CysQ [Flammeovirgaceae bacterium]
MNFSLKEALALAIKAAKMAGGEILDVYQSNDFQAESKFDTSPITIADKKAHKVIFETVSTLGLPILSEEGSMTPFSERSKWEYFWLIDPLDGTKEFISRTDDFVVNIALIHQTKPILGVMYAPVFQTLFYAIKGGGAFKEEKGIVSPIKTAIFSKSDARLKIVASRSHFDNLTKSYIEKLNQPQLTHIGSGLKFMLIACGEAHIYPRFAPTMEWDTAAPQIIVEEAGGKVLHTDEQSALEYNKEDLRNPYFISFGNIRDE